jgi:hypothetical protein
VNRIVIPLFLILSIFMVASVSATTTNSSLFGITYVKTGINTYNVTFWDNKSLNLTINEIPSSMLGNTTANVTDFSINRTMVKTYVINSNLTLVMLYNNSIVAQVTLIYTPLSSFFSLTINTLLNSTYLLQYHVLAPSTLIIKNATGATVLMYTLNNQFGSVYVPMGIDPNSAVIIHNNTPMVIQPFPTILQPQIHTIIVYEGISDKNAILIIFGSFFGSILVGIAIVTGTRRSKIELGTNKSDMVYDRLEDNPIANIKIEDPKKLNEFTALAQKIGELEAENRGLKDEVNILKSEMEKLKGRLGER